MFTPQCMGHRISNRINQHPRGSGIREKVGQRDKEREYERARERKKKEKGGEREKEIEREELFEADQLLSLNFQKINRGSSGCATQDFESTDQQFLYIFFYFIYTVLNYLAVIVVFEFVH